MTFSSYYFFALYLQNVLRFSPTQAGLGLLPYLAMNVLGSYLGSGLLIRFGLRRLLVLGGTIALAGLVLIAIAGHRAAYFPQVVLATSMVALGMNLALLPTMNIGTSIGHREAGLASGLINVSRRVGDSLGLAVLATVAAAHTRSLFPAANDSVHALASGYTRAFLVAAGLLVAGFTIALTWLPPYPTSAPERTRPEVRPGAPPNSPTRACGSVPATRCSPRATTCPRTFWSGPCTISI